MRNSSRPSAGSWLTVSALIVGLSLVAGPLLAQGTPTTGSVSKPRTAVPRTTVKSKPKPKGHYGVILPPANFAPPAIALSEQTYDWGQILQGELVQHTFQVENKGGADLRIERIRPSCGCTTVNFDKVIPPGGKGAVTLKIETRGFSGTVRKYADIHSNAGRAPEKIYMTGKIEPAFIQDPKIPRMQVVDGAPSEPLTISLRRASKLPIKVTSVKPKTDIVSATLAEVNPGELYHVNVTANVPDGQRKYHYAQLDASILVGEKTLTIPIRVSITIKERVEASPISVYFTSRDTVKLKQEGAKPLTKFVEIKSLVPGHKFKVTGIERDQGTNLFETKLDTVTEGEHYRLAVSLPKGPEDERSRRKVERIKVLTDDEKVPVLRVTATASFSTRATTVRRPGSFTLPTKRPGSPSARSLTPTPSGKVQKPAATRGSVKK
jgi:hypothetical protein